MTEEGLLERALGGPVSVASPGIYTMSNSDYHSSPGISRSGLWTIWNQTPAHFKYGEPKQSREFDVGTAVHDAILDPNQFDLTAVRGPVDRRGKKWEEAVTEAGKIGQTVLTASDYDTVLAMRDAVLANSVIADLVHDGLIEQAAFCEKDGTLVKCKPDLYSPEHKTILDLKTSRDGRPHAFARDCAMYGYSVQESFYTDVWQLAGGGPVEAFCFAVIEKEPPYAVALYELDANAVDEGRAVCERALALYAECTRTGVWPGYPATVQTLSLPRWSFKLTQPLDEEAEL